MKATIVCLCLAALPGWGQHDKPSPFDGKPVEEKRVQEAADPSGNTGVATFFRPKEGKGPESEELTAVHVSLPAGSRVRVVNLENSRSVVVRITGKAAFPPGRIISVEYRAAKGLDFLRSGTARVRVEAVEK